MMILKRRCSNADEVVHIGVVGGALQAEVYAILMSLRSRIHTGGRCDIVAGHVLVAEIEGAGVGAG